MEFRCCGLASRGRWSSTAADGLRSVKAKDLGCTVRLIIVEEEFKMSDDDVIRSILSLPHRHFPKISKCDRTFIFIVYALTNQNREFLAKQSVGDVEFRRIPFVRIKTVFHCNSSR